VWRGEKLESLIEQSVPDGPVAALLGRSKEVSTTGSPSSVSQRSPQRTTQLRTRFREPVVLRKIIGTLRNDRGMFVHETILSLLATWRQQDAPTKNFAEWSAAMR